MEVLVHFDQYPQKMGKSTNALWVWDCKRLLFAFVSKIEFSSSFWKSIVCSDLKGRRFILQLFNGSLFVGQYLWTPRILLTYHKLWLYHALNVCEWNVSSCSMRMDFLCLLTCDFVITNSTLQNQKETTALRSKLKQYQRRLKVCTLYVLMTTEKVDFKAYSTGWTVIQIALPFTRDLPCFVRARSLQKIKVKYVNCY